jgi:superfamily II DNA or RNA helicase
LGKTIETGISLRELNARRRADRILIICPAGICEQWQEEMASKFGMDFKVFDREGVHEARKRIELAGNPWATEPRIIASFDYLKRRDGAFREVQSLRFSVIVCDEVHHLADNTLNEDVSDRHRLAQWVSKAADALILLSATPHSGYDESFASLLNILEPTLVPDVKRMNYKTYGRYLIRHLKRHIKKPDGSSFFVQPLSSRPLPVQLSPHEAAVHRAVAKQAGELDAQAEKMKGVRDRYALRMVATVLRKRAASSLAALRATIENRTHNLGDAAEKAEIRRDHLRALRRGETIPDDALTQLEIDLHRSFMGQIRAAGQKIRSIEQEKEDLLELEELVNQCSPDTESKAAVLLNALRRIHDENPSGKVIVFSEYADTVDWLIGFLGRNGYEGKAVRFDGSLSGAQRKQALADFARPEMLLLVSTDAASEGLNLQEQCHRVIHYELPFNPNRMLQRQGRVDRFGQTQPCEFGFLYAEDTYEGEVLARLFTKIENQVRALGSVGDVLGALQADRIEQLISQSPRNIKAAIEEAERQIAAELAQLNQQRNRDLLGDAPPADDEAAVRQAVDAGRKLHVDVADFAMRAISLAGGSCRREGEVLTIPEVPVNWIGGRVPASYEALYLNHASAPRGTRHHQVLDDEHDLAHRAIRWVRESRYSRPDDHRLAVRLVPELVQPDLIATFLATIRAADHTEMDQLLAIRITADGHVDTDDVIGMLHQTGAGNVPSECIPRLFGSWWQEAVAKAEEVARQRAEQWRQSVRQKRFAEQVELERQFNQWAGITRDAIIASHGVASPLLPGMESILPPAAQRRLREHRKQVDHYQEFLHERLVFEEPAVEGLGVLLRVPGKEVA